MRRSSVLLPHPELPTTATNCPSWIARSMPVRATTGPSLVGKVLPTWHSRIAAAPGSTPSCTWAHDEAAAATSAGASSRLRRGDIRIDPSRRHRHVFQADRRMPGDEEALDCLDPVIEHDADDHQDDQHGEQKRGVETRVG